jgi:hypothetical protein
MHGINNFKKYRRLDIQADLHLIHYSSYTPES